MGRGTHQELSQVLSELSPNSSVFSVTKSMYVTQSEEITSFPLWLLECMKNKFHNTGERQKLLDPILKMYHSVFLLLRSVKIITFVTIMEVVRFYPNSLLSKTSFPSFLLPTPTTFAFELHLMWISLGLNSMVSSVCIPQVQDGYSVFTVQ